MKFYRFILTGIFILLLHSFAGGVVESTSKLTGIIQVEIGQDTTYCRCGIENLMLAPQLSVTGGIPPYSYSWSGINLKTKAESESYYPASYFLNDTTLANPRFINWWNNNLWNQLKLTVTDARSNIMYDSINIRFSEYYATILSEIPSHIRKGDSIFLNISNIDFGGISPYKYYSWEPKEGLSDPESSQTWCKPEKEIRYSCTLTDSAGCIGRTNTYWIIVDGTSIPSISNQKKVYQSKNTIFFNNSRNQEVSLQFYDLSGKFIAEYKTKSDNYSPDFGDGKKQKVLLCRVVINNSPQIIKYYVQ